MVSKTAEVSVGLFVAIGLGALFFLALNVSNFSQFQATESYKVTARFENIGGLKPRSTVSMGGVKVGQVNAIALDPETFEAIVTLEIDSRYKVFPKDSSASILTSGLLGEQFIGLEAGGEEEFLNDGDEIRLTEPALSLEKVIGQFIFSQGGDDE
jgi:phospholipid/cholesterol/gamma-HCH transport system substrate-binding protein